MARTLTGSNAAAAQLLGYDAFRVALTRAQFSGPVHAAHEAATLQSIADGHRRGGRPDTAARYADAAAMTRLIAAAWDHFAAA